MLKAALVLWTDESSSSPPSAVAVTSVSSAKDLFESDVCTGNCAGATAAVEEREEDEVIEAIAPPLPELVLTRGIPVEVAAAATDDVDDESPFENEGSGGLIIDLEAAVDGAPTLVALLLLLLTLLLVAPPDSFGTGGLRSNAGFEVVLPLLILEPLRVLEIAEEAEGPFTDCELPVEAILEVAALPLLEVVLGFLRVPPFETVVAVEVVAPGILEPVRALEAAVATVVEAALTVLRTLRELRTLRTLRTLPTLTVSLMSTDFSSASKSATATAPSPSPSPPSSASSLASSSAALYMLANESSDSAPMPPSPSSTPSACCSESSMIAASSCEPFTSESETVSFSGDADADADGDEDDDDNDDGGRAFRESVEEDRER